MLLKTFFGICLLRMNPQDLPTSNHLMLAALTAYGLADVIGVLDTVPMGKALLVALVDTALLAAATHLVLRVRDLENRIPQTLSAFAGSGAILSLTAWGIAHLTGGVIAAEWVWAPMLMWYALVFGHVLRHALSIPLAAGVAASLLYLVLSLGVTGLFIHPVPAES